MQRLGDHLAPLRTNATLRGSPSASASECYSRGSRSAPTNEMLRSGEPLAPLPSKTNGLAKIASRQKEQTAHRNRSNHVAAMLQQHGTALPQQCTTPTTTPIPTTPRPCTAMGPLYDVGWLFRAVCICHVPRSASLRVRHPRWCGLVASTWAQGVNLGTFWAWREQGTSFAIGSWRIDTRPCLASDTSGAS